MFFTLLFGHSPLESLSSWENFVNESLEEDQILVVNFPTFGCAFKVKVKGGSEQTLELSDEQFKSKEFEHHLVRLMYVCQGCLAYKAEGKFGYD